MMFDRQRWLARLAFSFLIIAVLLLWQAYRAMSEPPPREQWRIILYLVGGTLSLVLAAAGMRVRHQRDDDR